MGERKFPNYHASNWGIIDEVSLYKEIMEKQSVNAANCLAVKCDSIAYTYRELNQKIQQLANALKEKGVSKGDKVLLMIEDPVKFVLSFFATSYLEAVIIPLYFYTGINKVDAIIEKYDINFLISDSIQDVQNQSKVSNYSLEEHVFHIYDFDGVQDPQMEQIKLILFTSGTTNIPKAIMLSENNILSNVQAISTYLKMNSSDKILLIKNLSHSSSIVGELLVGLYNGCSVIMTRKIQVGSVILRIMEEDKITIFFAVPTILKDIMSRKNIESYDIASLRTINFYGASMHYQDILNLIDRFPKVNIIYSYGQTEASPRVTYIERDELIKRPASCGRPIEKVSVSIVDDDGNEVETMQKGEIIVSGPNVMQGYYKNPEKTSKVIVNGLLHTGDIGYLDGDGFLYITGRRDNMVISAGKNIYLEEIENTILLYDGVKEVLVQAKDDGKGIAELFAFIVVEEENDFDKKLLVNHCKQRLENYKLPKIITIVEKLEKTPSGKIKRNQF